MTGDDPAFVPRMLISDPRSAASWLWLANPGHAQTNRKRVERDWISEAEGPFEEVCCRRSSETEHGYREDAVWGSLAVCLPGEEEEEEPLVPSSGHLGLSDMPLNFYLVTEVRRTTEPAKWPRGHKLCTCLLPPALPARERVRDVRVWVPSTRCLVSLREAQGR